MMAAVDARLVAALEHARFEVIPIRGVGDQIPHLPAGATVTVTASPTKGLEPTLTLAGELSAGGFVAVPHLAARLIRSRRHLQEILRRLDAEGITEVFVIAGDAQEPAGHYEGAAGLLADMAEVGHRLTEIGITGYPESHAFISDEATIQAMFDKAPHATHIVSQICFDPAVTARWVDAVRERGVDLPIYVGLPGVVDRIRLLRICRRVGLGDSVRFLSKQGNVAAKLLTGYVPDELVTALTPQLLDERSRVRGWHLFTFNEVRTTELWRQHMLADLRNVA